MTDTGLSPQEFRQTLGRFASGVTIITARGDERRGMTASAFVSVSLQPPLILVSVDTRAHMHALLLQADVTHFGVNVLSATQRHLSDHFAGRPGPEDQVPWFEHEGLPLIGGSVAQLVCRARTASSRPGITRCSWASWSTAATPTTTRSCTSAASTTNWGEELWALSHEL